VRFGAAAKINDSPRAHGVERVVEIIVRRVHLQLLVVHPAEDEIVPHAEVVAPGQVPVAVGAPEAVHVVH
jgi:hypothetical protein